MRDTVMPAIKLFALTLIAALMLGGVNYITKEPIAQYNTNKQNAARREALKAADSFELMDMAQFSGDTDYPAVEEVYRGTAKGATVGYAIVAVKKGYGGEIKITVGINNEGKIDSVVVNSHSETEGLGSKCAKPEWLKQFSSKGGEVALSKNGGKIDGVSGATISSKAITSAVNDTLLFYKDYLIQGGAEQ